MYRDRNNIYHLSTSIISNCTTFYTSNKIKKNKEYHTVGTVPISNIKIIECGQIDTLTLKYMTTHLSGLMQALQ